MALSCLLFPQERRNLLFRNAPLSSWLARYFCGLLPDLVSRPGDYLLLFRESAFPVIPAFLKSDFCDLAGKAIAKMDPAREYLDLAPLPAWLLASASDSLPDFAGNESNAAAWTESRSPLFLFKESTPLQVGFVSSPPEIEREIQALVVGELLEKGCRIEDYNNFLVDFFSEIGRDSSIGSGAIVRKSRLAENVSLHARCTIENSTIGRNSVILTGSLIFDCTIGENVQLGPYCHLRMNTVIRDNAKVGNFVEIKKSEFGKGSKAMHLSYLGDATVGSGVNIGAGTITCNYDGVSKHPTNIDDNVFIGSGTELVAPVTVHENSYVGAGSTITQDVPPNSLAVARERQRTILDWVLKKRQKKG